MITNFGERLRELRKERGEKEPHSIEILKGIAKILEVPLKSLLVEESESDIGNNPVIKDLQRRVVRLEQVFAKFGS